MLTGLAAGVVLALLLAAAAGNGVSIEGAVSDPHETTRLRLLGIVSNVGVLVWTVTVAICLLVVVTIEPRGGARRWRTFFLASASITVVFLVDDLLLVHEFSDEVVGVFVDFDRTRQQKDILEAVVFAGYGVMFAIYCFLFRAELLGADRRRFLGAALVMFGVSLFVDLGGPGIFGIDLPDETSGLDLESVAEEGPKFLGIVYYSAFFLLLARSVLRATVLGDKTI